MDYMAPWLFWTLFLILWSTVVILGVLNWRRAGSRLNAHYPAPFVADPVETDPEKMSYKEYLEYDANLVRAALHHPLYDQDKDTK
jgi:hypothetical protein